MPQSVKHTRPFLMIDHVFLAPQKMTPNEAMDYSQAFLGQPDEKINVGKQRLALELTLSTQPLELDQNLQELAIPLAFYLDSTDLNPVSLDHEIAALSKKRYLKAIDWALKCNARHLLIPSFFRASYQVKGDYRPWFGRLANFWESILEGVPEESRLTLVMMNDEDQGPETTVALLKRLNHPNFKAGLDISKARLFSSLSPIDWLQALGDQTAYVRMVCPEEAKLFGATSDGSPNSHDAAELGALANHLALLNKKLSISFEGETLGETHHALAWFQPYLALQDTQYAAKRFLV